MGKVRAQQADGGVWANAWDVFRRTPSRGGRGRRAAVDFVVCFGAAGFRVFFCFVFFERTRTAASMRPPCLIYTSNSTGLPTERSYLICRSVGLSLCVSPCICATYVVLLVAGSVRG